MNASSIEQVIQLNNNAVSLLTVGQDRGALTSLSQALVMVQSMSTSPYTTATKTMATSATATSIAASTSAPKISTSSRLSNAGPLQAPLSACVVSSQHRLANLQDSSYFLYNHPVSIVEASSQQIEDRQSLLPVYSACVILNLALAYHRQGQTRKVCIVKAEKLYEMIIMLLREDQDETSVFLRLVAVNNVSYIHYQTGNFEQTKQELEYLAILIQQLSNSTTVSASDLDLLLLNVLLMTHPNVAPAA